MNTTTLNVFQKLIKARALFLGKTIKKTGINRHLEFKYFELDDIVPAITSICNELGLLFITTFTTDTATLTAINTDLPDQHIVFTSPIEKIESKTSKTGVEITNSLQNLGSVQTYLRRYLYLTAMDIVESDAFDNDKNTVKSEQPKASEENKKAPAPAENKKAPATKEERDHAIEQIANKDDQATPLQIKSLKAVFTEALEKYKGNNKVYAYIQRVITTTKNLANITRAQCELYILQMSDYLAKHPVTEATPTPEPIPDNTVNNAINNLNKGE
jgi:hypothetical protein